jgi:alpha-amylase
MPSVCMYFEVHQPLRLRRYSFFDIGRDHRYFDDHANREILRKVAAKSYLPTNRLLLRLIQRHEGRFKVAFSLTGLAMEQLAAWAPEALDSFKALADTGCVEFLGETYYHSLAAVHDPAEFKEQVRLHTAATRKNFGQSARVFRNTELIHNDAIGAEVQALGFKGMLAEGADDILAWRSPNYVYAGPNGGPKLLLKNYRLSDDVAFRFSNREWSGYPLTANTYAQWIHRINGAGELVNLFMDYETFGEHQWESTGIFEFLAHLPGEILRHPDWNFVTPSEAIERYQPVAELPFWRTVSWADAGRDLTAWEGNHMQRGALHQIYDMADAVAGMNNPVTLDLWRRLQTSDHFYYMCTKWFSDGDVHAYFSPYKSPYDAFIAYMNVLTDFRQSVLGQTAAFARLA